MTRILTAAGIGLLGIFLLPAIKPFIEEIAGIVSTGFAGQKGDAFLQLISDHAYLCVVAVWIIVIFLILFLGRDSEREVTR